MLELDLNLKEKRVEDCTVLRYSEIIDRVLKCDFNVTQDHERI